MLVVCTVVLYALIWFMGGAVASACMCFADRVVRRESWVHGHSHCNVCGHKLGILDLVPVFSCLFLRGRCRYCGTRFGYIHAIGECYLGIVYMVLWYCADNALLAVLAMLTDTVSFTLVVYLLIKRKARKDNDRKDGGANEE